MDMIDSREDVLTLKQGLCRRFPRYAYICKYACVTVFLQCIALLWSEDYINEHKTILPTSFSPILSRVNRVPY